MSNFQQVIDPAAMERETQQFLNPMSETALLTSIILHPEIMKEVRATLKLSACHCHGGLWRLMYAMAERAEAQNLPLAYDQLSMVVAEEALGLRIDRSHGFDPISEIVERIKWVTPNENWRTYISDINEQSAKIYTYKILREYQKSLATCPAADALLGMAGNARDFAARLGTGTAQGEDIEKAMFDVLYGPPSRRWANPRMPTFIGGLGDGGLRPGSMTVLTGRSKAGKSLMAANLILGFTEIQTPVLWLAAEMTLHEQMERFAKILESEVKSKDDIFAMIKSIKPYINYHSINDFQGALNLMYQFGQSAAGSGVIILDWLDPKLGLQMGNRPQWEFLGTAAKMLSALVAEIKLPMIVMNQENRAAIGGTIQERIHEGEKFGSGADAITHTATASTSIFVLPEEITTACLSATGKFVDRGLVIDVSRFSQSRVLIPLSFDIKANTVREVIDPEVVTFLRSYKQQKSGGQWRQNNKVMKMPPGIAAPK